MAHEITMANNAHPKHPAWLSALSDFLPRCLAFAADLQPFLGLSLRY